MPELHRRRRFALSYLTLVGLPVLGLVVILQLGGGLAPAGLAAAPRVAPPGANAAVDVPLLLAQVVVVIAVARIAGSALGALGQPRVVGEMAAGILLGPSVLGWAAPGFSAALFPPASLAALGALSQIGLLFFMFLVGLELDTAYLRQHGRTAVITSHASIVLPFLLGAALALVLYGRLAPPDVSFPGFALFLGAAMSVTAFPVLARILTERRLTRTRLGTLAIACAAVDDVTAWCILAGVVAIVRAGHAGPPLWAILAGSAAYVVLMLTAGRAGLARLAARATRRGGTDMLAVVALAVPASAWITERLGIHALFGAFLVGVVMPRDPDVVRGLHGRLEGVILVLLLPLFFALTGLRTRIALIDGTQAWLMCALVVGVAVVGKLGGTAVAGRLTGLAWRESLALGTLMNTRGLMELVILNVGLDVGVISPTLFVMMVLMALVTTFMTSPVLAWLKPAPQVVAAQERVPVYPTLER